MKNIKTKITIYMCSLCIGVLVLLALVSYYVSHDIVFKETGNKMTITSQKYSEVVNGWLEGRGKVLNEISNGLGNYSHTKKSDILVYLKNRMNLNSELSDLYIGVNSGELIDGSGWVPPSGYDATKRDWYKNAVTEKGIAYTPYYDLVTKKLVVSISMPIIEDDKIIGVIGEDIKMDSIVSMIQKSVPVANSYGYLIDGNKNVLVYPGSIFKANKDKFKTLSSVMNGKYLNIASESSNNNFVKLKDYDNISRYFITSKVKVSNWSIGLAVPVSEFDKSLNKLVYYFAFSLVVCLVVSLLVALVIGKRIADPILVVTKSIDELNKLNLNIKDEKLNKVAKNEDEIGSIAKAVLNLSSTFSQVVKELKSQSENISEHSNGVSEALNENVKSIDEISKTMEELAKGASLQADKSGVGVEKLNELSEAMNSIVTDADELEKYSQDAKESNNNGVEAVKLLVTKLENNNNAFIKVEDKINGLSEKSDSISQIIGVIGEIAAQTNLLALNAAIEAARAGENGKGFAVVAEEIRKLSDATASEVNNISDVINKIQTEIRDTKSSIDYSSSMNKEANESMTGLKDSFTSIENSVDNMVQNIKELSSKVNEVNLNKKIAVEAIEEISAISQESAAGNEEVAAAVEEQNSTVENIYLSTKELKSISEELEKIVNKFKV